MVAVEIDWRPFPGKPGVWRVQIDRGHEYRNDLHVIRTLFEARGRRPVIVALWAAALLALLYQTHRGHGLPIYAIDFRQVYYGAHNFRVFGDPFRAVPGVNVFVYPPSCALLLYPVGFLGLGAANATGLFLCALSAAALAMACGYLVERRAFGAFSAVVLLLICATKLGPDTISQGNLSLVVCALGAWALAAAVARRWILAGLLSAVAGYQATVRAGDSAVHLPAELAGADRLTCTGARPQSLGGSLLGPAGRLCHQGAAETQSRVDVAAEVQPLGLGRLVNVSTWPVVSSSRCGSSWSRSPSLPC